MKTSDILDIDFDKINKMSRNELAKLVSTLNGIANKRIKRLENAGVYSPALEWRKAHGRHLFEGVKGKERNELLSKFVDVSNFLKAKSSTISGAKKIERETRERLDADDDIDLRQFWNEFDNFRRNHNPLYNAIGSDAVQKVIKVELKNGTENLQGRIFKSTYELYLDMQENTVEDYEEFFNI